MSKPTAEEVLMSCNGIIPCKVMWPTSDIGGLLQKYWEIEITGISREDEYCSDDREALRIADESLTKLQDDWYQIAMSWKNDPKGLPDNYETGHKRLVSTEKRLLRD